MKNTPSIEDLLDKENSRKPSGQQVVDLNRDFEEKETAKKAAELGYSFVDLRNFPIDLEVLAEIP
jgi:hypothetical protein